MIDLKIQLLIKRYKIIDSNKSTLNDKKSTKYIFIVQDKIKYLVEKILCRYLLLVDIKFVDFMKFF